MPAHAPRPIWAGSISFGLVNVPVRLFPATAARELRFHMLHDKDGGRIREKRVCESDGEEVAYEHVVKGFPLDKASHVILTREELANLAPRASKSIDIEDFVDLGEIDPVFYSSTYFLVPEPRAAHAYALLLRAMEKSSRVGIARVVLRTKQYLCALRPLGRALALSTLHYADELVSIDSLEGLPDLAKDPPAARELAMATQLIDGLTSKFDPARYRDEHREKLMELIEHKARGEKIVTAEPSELPPETGGDLAEVLARSLARVKSPERGERRHRASTSAHSKRTKRH